MDVDQRLFSQTSSVLSECQDTQVKPRICMDTILAFKASIMGSVAIKCYYLNQLYILKNDHLINWLTQKSIKSFNTPGFQCARYCAIY